MFHVPGFIDGRQVDGRRTHIAGNTARSKVALLHTTTEKLRVTILGWTQGATLNRPYHGFGSHLE